MSIEGGFNNIEKQVVEGMEKGKDFDEILKEVVSALVKKGYDLADVEKVVDFMKSNLKETFESMTLDEKGEKVLEESIIEKLQGEIIEKIKNGEISL